MEQRNTIRLGQWLLLVSAAMFVAAIAFVIAGARAGAASPEAPVTRVETRPVANVKQIMQGIVVPASTVIYEAVKYTADASGITETRPQTDEEWARVEANAAALAEVGNLLMMEGHAFDREQWVVFSKELIGASELAVKAAKARDADALLDAGSTVTDACDHCHARYAP